MKIKIFKEIHDLKILESVVNAFLRKHKVTDIKYICNDYSYSCMVVYEESELDE